ncbi:baseplate multidomain protein megatron [Paenirhodobacter populi]|uniref:baseplate multidomain protein megatron n=1 Tax=Paenirhodobacter populi TaxID=2306993 RepID=UPI000FE3749B|nr:glycoside hydrolase TIM-barrel-like domain-containing protein [Sinirhodobacter populi]RWR10882.1 host specificity protein [Sinirhodobacter populi]
MATILFSAAGGAIGAGFGGTILGLSGAVIGRAAGAVVGHAIDQRLLGSGSQSVETGRVERLRMTSAAEGEAVGILWGRMRVAGQVIWATRFFESAVTTKQSSGGKGSSRSGGSVTTTSYSYSVSLAIALCEGEILRVGRIWADGTEVDRSTLNLRVYRGSEDQLPDPKIAAVEGAEEAPAYRGIAYVVIEDLQLAPFGNRVPIFSFEVMRAAGGAGLPALPDLTRAVRGVSMIPGTGEYSLATTRVYQPGADGQTVAVNENAPGGITDFSQSVQALDEELPACGSVSLVVSWFGTDLRCGECLIRPEVSEKTADGSNMPWRVSGLTRQTALQLPELDGGAVYGGTPADASVIEAIRALREAGKAVTFYPFILMEQMAGNTLPDPWSGAVGQAPLPWRGRITLSAAPGREDSPDGTAAAAAEVAAFFGAAVPGDYHVRADTVDYAGPQEWSMRRFILHYAHLCVLAGGVDAFCIGTEMVALTQIRGPGNSFPAVAALRALARDVREILGPDCKIGYAADWSEYFGYHPGDGECFFHLDPLWADPEIDFIGIDNYMPLSDWRDGTAHLDAEWRSIYNPDYLKANIEAGEGFDWYYEHPEHRDAQIRTPITDGEGEPWLWRYKDIRNWWTNFHHQRVGGVRDPDPTEWVPQSKPIWFTELGCAAVDKGTNQPNKFHDPKSSESALPYYSNGRRDELIQMQYLRAMLSYWDDPARNPVSPVYGGPMIDMGRAHVWAWDARPYPQFPQRWDLWADSDNYARGHWISGRAVSQPLDCVVAEICHRSGVRDVDTHAVYGVVRGFVMEGGQSGRAALQSLCLAYGMEAVERDGTLAFRMRDGLPVARLTAEDMALGENDGAVETIRAPEAESSGRVRFTYLEADGDFETASVEAVFPDEEAGGITGSEIPVALTRALAQGTAERWLAEARVARDTARFVLPPSLGHLGAGDVVTLDAEEGRRHYRIDRVERAEAVSIEAVRVEAGVYEASDEADVRVIGRPFAAPVPVTTVFLDLPLMTGEEDPVAPHLAVNATPWPGSVAVYAAVEDAGYALDQVIDTRAAMGVTLSPLHRAQAGVWDRGAPLRVRMDWGSLASVSPLQLFSGDNLMAIGDGLGNSDWELFQFAGATPVAPGEWELTMRLRGQLGTDGIMPDVWPEGSRVVVIDAALRQISLPASARGLMRHYRIGPALQGYDDPSYIHREEAFFGIGQRPLSPCHLRGETVGEGVRFRWTRRTRIDGDSWEGYDVPLGETREAYLVRVLTDGVIRREVVVTEPVWLYSTTARLADGAGGAYRVEVAQISDAFGVGPAARWQASG